jgi:hypothetical protein
MAGGFTLVLRMGAGTDAALGFAQAFWTGSTTVGTAGADLTGPIGATVKPQSYMDVPVRDLRVVFEHTTLGTTSMTVTHPSSFDSAFALVDDNTFVSLALNDNVQRDAWLALIDTAAVETVCTQVVINRNTGGIDLRIGLAGDDAAATGGNCPSPRSFVGLGAVGDSSTVFNGNRSVANVPNLPKRGALLVRRQDMADLGDRGSCGAYLVDGWRNLGTSGARVLVNGAFTACPDAP